jgi:hypothetical protein
MYVRLLYDFQSVLNDLVLEVFVFGFLCFVHVLRSCTCIHTSIGVHIHIYIHISTHNPCICTYTYIYPHTMRIYVISNLYLMALC